MKSICTGPRWVGISLGVTGLLLAGFQVDAHDVESNGRQSLPFRVSTLSSAGNPIGEFIARGKASGKLNLKPEL